MRNKTSSIPFFLSLMTLAACGGGGGGGGAAAPVPSASLSSLLADRLTAPADGATEVLLTAIVRDTVGTALAGRNVRFDVVGNGTTLNPASTVSINGGVANARLTANVPGQVTVTAVVSPDGDNVRLDASLTITFVSANAPVVQGPARFEDADFSATASAGDRLVVPFSTAVAVSGASANDFVLPVQDDTFGVGATVLPGPADNEVTITLGAQPRLRTRGPFDAARLTNNEPSGIDLQNGQGISSVADGTPASASSASDIAAGPVADATIVNGGQVFAVGDVNGDFIPDVLVADNGDLTPLVGNNGAFTVGAAASGQPVTDVAVSNLNRIGNAEVITGNAIGVQIWNATGASGAVPTLSPANLVATGPANGIAIADVNEDGFPDIVAATTAGVVVALHQRNLGNTYAIGQSVFLSQAARDVIVADIDADGDQDVLALLNGSVEVLRNDGGTLVQESPLGAAFAEQLSTGDTDGDGVVEILVSGQGSASLFDRQADGSYSESAVVVTAAKSQLVDLDGDSFADLAAINSNGVDYLQNDRNGAFVPFGSAAVFGLVDIAAADLDRDGDRDLLALTGNSVRSFRGSLAGTFGDTVLDEILQLGTEAIGKQELADVNGDGFTDRVVSIANAAQVWLGDGAGGFTVGTNFGPSATISAIALGDMDNDGDVDAVLGYDDGAQANAVWVNDGNGVFTFAWAFSAGTVTRSFGLTDFNQDGLLDVFVGNDGNNQVYVNTLAGGSPQLFLDANAFDNLLPQALGNETIAVLVFDFDREGDEDIILINGGDLVSPQDAYVLRRSGTGYTLLNTLNAQLLATAATIADVDGDGREDLAIAQLSSNGSASVKWFRGFNTSISTLSTNVATNGQYFSRSLVVEDVNGDGRSDFVVCDVSVSNQPIAVIEQQADGSFQVGQEFPTTRCEAIDAGDFDRDGDVDLVSVETTGPSRIIENR